MCILCYVWPLDAGIELHNQCVHLSIGLTGLPPVQLLIVIDLVMGPWPRGTYRVCITPPSLLYLHEHTYIVRCLKGNTIIFRTKVPKLVQI